ncbi:MAG TPA: zf-HC2 domain-containing protein [Verrucomicrobiae bacterium]
MKRLFDPCRRWRQSICLLASGTLSGGERAEVERHLGGCADCRKYLEELRAVTVPLAEWPQAYADLQPRVGTQARWNRAIRIASQNPATNKVPETNVISQWWLEVIWPWRRVWVGLAVIWVAIVAGNVSLRDPAPAMAMKSSPKAQEIAAAFRDQQKVLAELLADHATPSDADRPRPFSPKPRTEYAAAVPV